MGLRSECLLAFYWSKTVLRSNLYHFFYNPNKMENKILQKLKKKKIFLSYK
jgi:hypothetical protein